jgi:hypothetical protein
VSGRRLCRALRCRPRIPHAPQPVSHAHQAERLSLAEAWPPLGHANVMMTLETLVRAAVAAHVIDKGIPTTGLLAQVLVAESMDHPPEELMESGT